MRLFASGSVRQVLAFVLITSTVLDLTIGQEYVDMVGQTLLQYMQLVLRNLGKSEIPRTLFKLKTVLSQHPLTEHAQVVPAPTRTSLAATSVPEVRPKRAVGGDKPPNKPDDPSDYVPVPEEALDNIEEPAKMSPNMVNVFSTMNYNSSIDAEGSSTLSYNYSIEDYGSSTISNNYSSDDDGSYAISYNSSVGDSSTVFPSTMEENVLTLKNNSGEPYNGSESNSTKSIGFSSATIGSLETITSLTQENLTGIKLPGAPVPQPRQRNRQSVALTADNACTQNTRRIFSSLQDGDDWAIRVVDSWGKPGAGVLLVPMGFVGDYDQCRRTVAPADNKTRNGGFTGQYCVVSLMPQMEPNNSLEVTFSVEATIDIGACMPNSCSTDDVYEIFQRGLGSVNMSSLVSVSSVDCRNDQREMTTATVCAIIILALVGCLLLLGTGYDLAFVQWPVWTEKRDETRQRGSHSEGAEQAESITGNGQDKYKDTNRLCAISLPDSPGDGVSLLTGSNNSYKDTLIKVLLSFSVYTNTSKLLDTSQRPGTLNAIHGIRFLSISWIVLCHLYVFGIRNFVNVATKGPALSRRWTFDAVTNALIVVDTFFAISGLLTSYLTCQELDKKGWRRMEWGKFYFHRYWRLTPPYLAVLVVILGLQRFMGSGALWSSTQPKDKEECEANWWTNILYLNNIVNLHQMCMPHTWFLASDFQFYLISPLMILPFYFNWWAGLGSCCLFLVSSWLLTLSLSISKHWPDYLFQSLVDWSGPSHYVKYYYYGPFCRVGPFVVGVLAGFFLFVSGGCVKMKWYHVVAGWLLTLSVMISTVYGIHGDISGDDVSSVGVAALYNTFARSAWGAAVCWVIVACVSGYGGPVNALLSWTPFKVMGRLTYIAYLVHPTIIYVYLGNMDRMFYLNDTNIAVSFLGVAVLTYAVSYLLVLAFEAPMVGLEKIFLARQR